jgi:hypothetical protein
VRGGPGDPTRSLEDPPLAVDDGETQRIGVVLLRQPTGATVPGEAASFATGTDARSDPPGEAALLGPGDNGLA